ncbi:MAG: hypothetical protein PF445_00875 [Melioribacteraceae bacterium]|nr:hypothetical protein [Melioribacteraceae bacterium]
MKREMNILNFLVILVLVSSLSFAQDSTKVQKENQTIKHQNNQHRIFIDADGDGYNDNAPDHDKDGIPNGLDSDYIKLGKRKNSKSIEYVDSDGDGINDNIQFNGKRKRNNKFKQSNKGIYPQSSNGNSGMDNNPNQGQKGKGKGKGKG